MGMFDQLPNEILLKIFDNNSLSDEDLISASRVCQRFEEVCENLKFWTFRFQRRWPWVSEKIPCELKKTSGSLNWKKEVEAAIEINNKLEELLSLFRSQLFKYESITPPHLQSISEIFQIGTFGDFVVLNDVFRIVCNERKDLTKHYYAKHVLFDVYHHFCKKEFIEFFNLPLEKQTLEKGAFYFGKWFNPEEFYNIEYGEISSKLDKLAIDIQAYLKPKKETHPAVSIKLFSPEDHLEKSIYSDDDCVELFECINRVLFIKHKFRWDSKEDCLNVVLDTKAGSRIILCIIYKAVSHRLGIPLQVDESSEDEEGLIWRAPDSGNTEFINPFTGVREIRNIESEVPPRPHRISTAISVLEKLAFRSLFSITEIFKRRELRYIIGMVVILLTFQKECDNYPVSKVYDICVRKDLHLETLIEICKKTPKINSKVRLKVVKKKLAQQLKGPIPITPKTRENNNSKFATGMIVGRKGMDFTGVIIGWEVIPKCKKNKFNSGSSPLRSLKKREQNIIYRVLSSSDELSFIEEKLVVVKEGPALLENPNIGRYFRRFNGRYYVPNEGMRSEYPDDEKFTEEFFKHLK